MGNVLLGASIGLACYSFATDLVTRYDQSRMRAEAPRAFAGDVAVETTSGPELDFTGWGSQDLTYWQGLPEGAVFGRLVAEAMGLDALVVKGTERADLAKGPGWITWTDFPGPDGNVGISGHRTTFGAPFGKLDRLKPGDTIDLYSPYRRYRYEVVEQLVVTPNRTDVASHTVDPWLTMTACHPPYSARYRLVVRSRLVEVRRIVGAAEAAE